MESIHPKTPTADARLAQARDIAQTALNSDGPEALTGARTEALMEIIRLADMPLLAMTRDEHAQQT